MNEISFRKDNSQTEQHSPKMYSPTLQPLLQSLLSTLADIDFEYEQAKDKVSKNSPDTNLKIKVLEKLRAQHHERRMPYIQQLAVLQERMIPHR
ncbi:hypothetical protein [Microvirga guangxiensis]|uniref:DUF465 domain-containing protein n=1 Tax=Microvirga guangxiensis TaxID=549386 RepID=A0A1G5BKB0_9HYPH|nr:hypothetical protein [Microvirga guangxiensis]SCX90578.1 hypothetical protein SAMN02927923_00268 [Microvirga guangxiensis]